MTQEVHLWIVAGQSKMLGYGLGLDDLPPPMTGSPGATFVFGMGATWWGQLYPGVNTGSPNNPEAWGPWVQAAFDFRQDPDHSDDILLIVPWTPGSTGLAQVSGSDWHPNSAGEAFDMMTSRLAAAEAALGDSSLFDIAKRTLMFQGGETDGTALGPASFVGASLHDFLQASNDEWDWEKAIIARVSEDTDVPYDFMVAKAQYDEANNPYWMDDVKSIGTTFGRDTVAADGVHGTAQWNVLVGHGLYDEFHLIW